MMYGGACILEDDPAVVHYHVEPGHLEEEHHHQAHQERFQNLKIFFLNINKNLRMFKNDIFTLQICYM